MLPILLEFVHPTKTKTTNLETTAGSQQSPICDEQSLPVMVPRHHHTKSNQPKMTPPSTTPNETGPISLKQFNHAAADLDAKGEIQWRKYHKYLLDQSSKQNQ